MCRRRRSSILNRILHHPTPCADGVVLACLCGSLAFSRNLGVVSSNQLLTQSKLSINSFLNNIEKHIKRLTNIMPRKHKSFSWRRGQLQFVDGVGKGMYRCGCFSTVRRSVDRPGTAFEHFGSHSSPPDAMCRRWRARFDNGALHLVAT